jgi:hypothetical protein
MRAKTHNDTDVRFCQLHDPRTRHEFQNGETAFLVAFDKIFIAVCSACASKKSVVREIIVTDRKTKKLDDEILDEPTAEMLS